MHTRHDALGQGRQDTLPAGEAPPRADRPSLSEADARRLIADAVSKPPQVLHTQPQVPSRAPMTNTIDDAARPLPLCSPHPARLTAHQAPPSREKGPMRPKGGAAAPELRQGLAATHMSPRARPRLATDGRTSQLCRRILAAAGSTRGPDQPAAAHAQAGPPRPGSPDLAAEDVLRGFRDVRCTSIPPGVRTIL